MIRITIELVPYGIEDKKEVLHVGEIWNDATGTPTSGNYCYRLKARQSNRIFKHGSIQGFPRKHLSAWYLLKLVLDDALGK